MAGDDLATAAKLLLLAATIALAGLAWARNRDPFAPTKVYLAYSVFFYLGVYTDAVRWQTLACYAALLAGIGVALVVESGPGAPAVTPPRRPRHLYALIWLVSLPGLLVKALLVHEAGGLVEYAYNLAFRVEQWSGRGHLVIWFNMFPALNLFYFAALLSDARRTRKATGAYLLHFALFVAVGLLTGSRSFIAIALLGMLFVYSYVVRRVPVRWIAAGALGLVLFAGVYGSVRNRLADPDALEEAVSAEGFEVEQTRYGTIPLELVFRAPELVHMRGSTYLSLFTNVLPRSLFPGKLDTGGVVFTRAYTGHQDELSRLATGAVAEGVLNFGKPIGVPFGIALNGAMLLAGCALYNRLGRVGGGVGVFGLVAYFYFLLAAARFSYAEFTDLFHSLALYAILPCALVALLHRGAGGRGRPAHASAPETTGA